jgi:hypothetical protein
MKVQTFWQRMARSLVAMVNPAGTEPNAVKFSTLEPKMYLNATR